MNKSYNELMDKINVTEEMKERVVKNVAETVCKNKAHETVRKFVKRKYFSVAACLIVVLFAVAIPMFNRPPEVSQKGYIGEYSSVEELSSAVGFDVGELGYVPYGAEASGYVSIGEDLAQVMYESEEGSVTYRKSSGNEDNSGDYNVYENTETGCLKDGTEVIMKGSGELWQLAVWQKDGYSYSLSFYPGVDKDEFLKTVESAI